MGFGVLLILFISDLEKYKIALITSFGIVIIGGIGRLISVMKLGVEQGNLTMAYSILAVELLIVLVLLAWLILSFNNL